VDLARELTGALYSMWVGEVSILVLVDLAREFDEDDTNEQSFSFQSLF